MKSYRVPLRVVFYRDESAWVAHCLEFDLMGDGETQEEAYAELAQAIRCQVQACMEQENPDALFTPAEGKYFEMWAAGGDATMVDLRLEGEDAIKIPGVECREYLGVEPALV